jgi:tetratricopeptide (TPR) repeat protein
LIDHLHSLIAGHSISKVDCPTVTNPLPWQLGINQSFLLETTAIVYSQKFPQLFISFEEMFLENEILLSSFNDFLPNYSSLKIKNYENCRKLSNIIHHYCHAIEYLDSLPSGSSLVLDGINLPSLRETKELRKQLYSFLKRNVDFLFLSKNSSKEVMITSHGLFSSDELETIKAVVVAGQHLLHDSLTLSVNDRINMIIPQLLKYLQFLFPHIRPLQRSSLEMIQGTLFIEESILFVNSQNYQKALKSIETTLAIMDRLAESSGNHILLHPLLIKGNILSLLRRYKDTFIVYDQCLEIINAFDFQKEKEKEEEVIRNQFFEFRLQVYYNYGLALQEFQPNHLKGKHFFEQALSLLRQYYSIVGDVGVCYCSQISNLQHQNICWNICKLP